MNYLARTATVAVIIALVKLFLGRRRRRSDDSNNDTSQQSDSTSTSTSGDSDWVPLPIGEYEVFLSFRGPDTRSNITNILYRFLARSKVHTFRDDDELRKGEGIWPNLVRAIGQSKISIPILSPRYAESKWCLKELVEITEHRKREKGHIVLPIFYKVDPRDVRHQSGPYQIAFQRHKRNKFDEETIQSWKAALNEIGSLKGWHIKTKEEEVDVADLVSGVVWSHLSKNNNVLETDELVRIDDHVKQVVDMLDLGSEGVNLVGVHGMGGIGKTTLATAVYNNVSACFDRYSFVKDIRETQLKMDGVLVLQKKFISNILRMDLVVSIVEVSEAKKIIRGRVTQFKTLVVLDDVDEKFNLEEVLGNLEDFASGSRFIVTSRDLNVLKRLSKCQSKLYEVQGMNPSRSLQLFCKYAFRKDFPPLGFEALSANIVSTTGGLPLTLKVIGSLLFRVEKVLWTDKLEQLRQIPEKGVMDRLIISYNDLEHEAQQIFLDIACFYIGEDKEMASYMWIDCNFHPAINIYELVQRSMLKIGDRNEFQMHDQLRDMGTEIVRRENIEHPQMRSRIWSGEEANQLLVDSKGTNQVKAIRAHSENDPVLELQNGCFTNLTELRYFHGRQTNLRGDFSHLLRNLKWLRLEVYRCSSPGTACFNVKNLIIFQSVRHYRIQTKEANKLKVLILSDCDKMSKLPEFPESGSLEILHIACFENKDEDLEIGKLCNLKVLRLDSCQLGTIKGGTIGTTMKGLRELDLSDTDCDYDSFRRLIVDIEELQSLQILNVASSDLEDVLEGIKLPRSLKLLNTTSAFANLDELLDLEILKVNGGCMTTELVIPRTISWVNSSKLTSMTLWYMKRIIMVESKSTMLPNSLTKLALHSVHSNEIPNLKNLSNLIELEICSCLNLQVVQDLGGMKSLQILSIYNMDDLTRINGLGTLMSSVNCSLKEVHVRNCPLLRAVLTFEQQDDDAVQIESLLRMEIMESPSIDGRSTPRLSKTPMLKYLTIGEISLNINEELQLLEGLENLEELTELRVSHLPKVQRLPSLSKLSKLSSLRLEDLPGLREIAGLGGLKSLKLLFVRGCLSLERLPISDLPYSSMHRIVLDLRGCTNFIDIESDLSPLERNDQGELSVIIQWPHEPLRDSETQELDSESDGESDSEAVSAMELEERVDL